MANCLVTKLKATVDNPNLPVLETLQQFTLDAIARGGNMSMSDEKKYALNHFFYEVGAIGNNALWGKFRMLLLPIIGVDKSHIGLDYKDTDCYLKLNENIGNTGGELYSLTENNTLEFNKTIEGLWNSYTNLLVCTTDGHEVVEGTASRLDCIVRNTNERIIKEFGSFVGSAQYIACLYNSTNGHRETRIAATESALMMCNYDKTTTKIWSKDTQGNLSTESQSSGSIDFSDTITPNKYLLQMSPGGRYGIIADFAEELTEAESLKVLNAAEALRNAFKS